ncbi:MAG: winged helix DNA-binding domain-containing protein [Actinomycetota bacterium]|nr:winged helix DNA-binding domain-containing protein [Actinomycetota bacterium]
MGIRRLDRDEARQLAVRAQLLDATRPTELVELVDGLTLLQLDPTAAIAPNADLVAWSRLGASYQPLDLTRALEEDRTLFELRAFVRPTTAVALHVPEDTGYTAHPGVRAWVEANDGFRRDVVARLRDAGPLLSRDVPDTSQVPWGSTGWTNNRNVTQTLELLSVRGEVAVAGRAGRQRLWDLPDRVYPHFEPLPADQAQRRREVRRLRSLGIARARTSNLPGESIAVGDAGVPVAVEGLDGEWRADPDALDQPFTGRTALLSPFDRLVHDRDRTQGLFDFEYILEMYKPAAKRRWGYFALPVLHHDRLVGKLDAKADRKAGTFAVKALHEDVRFTKAMRADVEAEIEALAAWLGLAVIRA